MSNIDVERSGFTLVQKRARQTGDVWHPDQGAGEWHPGQDAGEIRKLYNIDKTPESDIPFVEMMTTSPIKY